MKRLFIEYGPKDYGGYESLLRHGGKQFELIEPTYRQVAYLSKAESDRINKAVDKLSRATNISLQTLAIGAFLPSEQTLWRNLIDAPNPINEGLVIFRTEKGQSRLVRKAQDQAFPVECYLPPAVIDPDIMRQIDKLLIKDVDDVVAGFNILKSRCTGDKWAYRKLVEAPPCEACDWSTDEISAYIAHAAKHPPPRTVLHYVPGLNQ